MCLRNKVMIGEDNEIIEGCKMRKPMSQKALYDKYSAKMFSVCLRYARSKADAEDIFQDAFVKVFDVIKQFKFIGSFEGWLRRIFINYALNYYRSDKKHTSISEERDDIIGVDTRMMRSRFTQNEILFAIKALPDNQRLVFNLVEVEGYSYDEVSIDMNMPTATVRVLNFRAKTSLRKTLLDKENFEL